MPINGNNYPNKMISLKIKLIIFPGKQNSLFELEGRQLE